MCGMKVVENIPILEGIVGDISFVLRATSITNHFFRSSESVWVNGTAAERERHLAYHHLQG